MSVQPDRRNSATAEEEELAPEVVAVLVMCGAPVRATDHEAVEVAQRSDALDRRRPEQRRHESN